MVWPEQEISWGAGRGGDKASPSQDEEREGEKRELRAQNVRRRGGMTHTG